MKVIGCVLLVALAICGMAYIYDRFDAHYTPATELLTKAVAVENYAGSIIVDYSDYQRHTPRSFLMCIPPESNPLSASEGQLAVVVVEDRYNKEAKVVDSFVVSTEFATCNPKR